MTWNGTMKPVIYYSPDPDTGGSNGGDPAGQKPEAKTYTQAELDAMFADRARRAQESALNDVLTKTGVKSLDELTAALTKAREADDAQKTELQREQEARKKAEEKIAEAEAKAAAQVAAANEKLLRSMVIAEAAARGFRTEAVNDVWLMVDRTKLTEKDGEFQGVKEAVEAVAKSRPFWVTDGTGKTKGTPGSGKQPEPVNGKQPETAAPTRRLTL